MANCNSGIREDGVFKPCKFEFGHLGNHEYEIPKDDTQLSNRDCVIGMLVCPMIIIGMVLIAENQLIPAQGLGMWNPLNWIWSAITFFSGIGFLVCFGTLINNKYKEWKESKIPPTVAEDFIRNCFDDRCEMYDKHDYLNHFVDWLPFKHSRESLLMRMIEV